MGWLRGYINSMGDSKMINGSGSNLKEVKGRDSIGWKLIEVGL